MKKPLDPVAIFTVAVVVLGLGMALGLFGARFDAAAIPRKTP